MKVEVKWRCPKCQGKTRSEGKHDGVVRRVCQNAACGEVSKVVPLSSFEVAFVVLKNGEQIRVD